MESEPGDLAWYMPLQAVLAIILTVILVSALLDDLRHAFAGLPTREQAEASVVSSIGEDRVSTVTCDEPSKTGFNCRLRDPQGRYGYFFAISSNLNEDPAPMANWDFPIDVNGRLVEDLQPKRPWDIDTSIGKSVLLALNAIEPGDVPTWVECPDEVVIGSSAPCTTSGLARSARLHRLDVNRFRLELTFTLPSS